MEFRALVSETEFFTVFLDSSSESAEVLYSLRDSLVEHVSSKGVWIISPNLLLRKDPQQLGSNDYVCDGVCESGGCSPLPIGLSPWLISK